MEDIEQAEKEFRRILDIVEEAIKRLDEDPAYKVLKELKAKLIDLERWVDEKMTEVVARFMEKDLKKIISKALEETGEKPELKSSATVEDLHSVPDTSSIEIDYTGSTTASPSTRDVDRSTSNVNGDP